MLRIVKLGMVMALVAVSLGASKADKAGTNVRLPDLLLEGGRRLTYERTFSSEKDVRGKPGFWTKLVNVVIGAPEYKHLLRPYGIAVDSRGRQIVTDPGAGGVHVFDFARHKYKFIERQDKRKDAMLQPQCVAIDAQDNIYVTDSIAGKIFVFNADGKFQRALGSLKGGEGFYKRPTGLAVDSSLGRIYVTDTLRDRVYILDMQGQVIKSFGQRGSSPGELNYPTELLLHGNEVAVVDAMNFRIQFFDPNGVYRGTIGQGGDSSGDMFRPKGIGVDSEGHYYLVDALWNVVQVFDRDGSFLYYFGKRGIQAGDFQLPTGLFIDHEDRVFVVDSFNHRVQVFRYFGLRTQGSAP